MILFYLHQSAHIIDKIRESDVELRPQNPDSPEKQSLHALLHKSESMFYPATFPCLVPVAFLLFIRELGVPVVLLYYLGYKFLFCYHVLISNVCRVSPKKTILLVPASIISQLWRLWRIWWLKTKGKKSVDCCPLSVDNPEDYEKIRFVALIYTRRKTFSWQLSWSWENSNWHHQGKRRTVCKRNHWKNEEIVHTYFFS